MSEHRSKSRICAVALSSGALLLTAAALLLDLDDFHVLVSLVRSRRNLRGGEFVRQFQRVNVALSRARDLLIIIGAQTMFRRVNVDLPPLDGGPSRPAPIYREILELIKRFGGLRYAAQILHR